MKLCDYGCGGEGKYYFKHHGGKWCCSESWNSCPAKKERSRIGNVGKKRTKEFCLRNSSFKMGSKYSEESKDKLKGPRRRIENIKTKYIYFSKEEEMRYNPENNKEIQVHCKNSNCKNSKEYGGWFTPTGRQLELRIYELEQGNKKGFMYCCKECKIEDPDYHSRVDPYTKKLFLKYRFLVDRYTSISIKNFNLENISLRGRKHGYSLDHIYSIWDGFINNVNPEIVGHIKNLRMISINKNSVKHKRSEISIDNLMEQIQNFMNIY